MPSLAARSAVREPARRPVCRIPGSSSRRESEAAQSGDKGPPHLVTHLPGRRILNQSTGPLWKDPR